MFRKLFRGQARPALVASVPPGMVVYAIGDVHGRQDLLAPLLREILEPGAGVAERQTLVFLGDYIDRGAGSAGVIELLVELAGARTIETRFLLGNHDETLLDFLRDPTVGPAWCDYGGRDTMQSYGVTPPTGRGDPDSWAACADALASAMPPAHLAFFKRLEESVAIGDYFFAHAGAKPGVPLELQSHRDLLWIRETFIDDDRRFDKVIVHGHTPAEAVHSDGRRIGLDTGAYATGTLSAVRLEGQTRSFLQVVGTPGEAARVVRFDDARVTRRQAQAAHA